MRKVFFAARLLTAYCGFSALVFCADDRAADPQLRAMTDEIQRSKTIRLNELDKPYFIRYASDDADVFTVSASLGGLLQAQRSRVREPHIEVRVGQYQLDNTNALFTRSLRLGSLPLDDDYPTLRTALWIDTDVSYKQATSEISTKRTVRQELSEPDNTPDFSPAAPFNLIKPLAKLDVDQKAWTQVVRRVSGRFSSYPDVLSSVVRMRGIGSNYRTVNSEGTTVRVPEEISTVEIRASAMAKDGSRVWNSAFMNALRPAGLPNEQDLTKAAERIATETTQLVNAPGADEYTGPVLFDGEAAAQMMAQALGESVRLLRRPLAPRNAQELPLLDSVWATKLNTSVLPEWMNVVEDPTLTDFHGTPLLGHFEVDEEGIPAQKVSLVENGILKNFLLTRQPVRNFHASNGHGRLPGMFGATKAVLGNVVIQVKQQTPQADLKAKLIEMAKAAGLKYGMMLRRLDYPSTMPLEQLQGTLQQLQKSGSTRSLTAPLLAYRVYLDGREELVRNVRFREFSAKDLKNIQAASDQPFVLNYINNGSSFNFADAPASATVSSMVCPSLLFDSVDLDKAQDRLNKPPVVPPPPLVAGQ